MEGDLARLARAEARLGTGDLAGSVAEIDGLTGSAASVAADWRRAAAARLAQDDAGRRLAALSAGLLAPDATVSPSN
jgi:hypothetical protein